MSLKTKLCSGTGFSSVMEFFREIDMSFSGNGLSSGGVSNVSEELDLFSGSTTFIDEADLISESVKEFVKSKYY